MKQSVVRWTIIVTTSLLTFGNYYAYDVPASINRQLQKHLQMSEEEFANELNAYYSLYSFPNIILPFFGGALMDFTGIHRMVLVVASIVCLGQLLFCLGVQYRSLMWTWAGRCLLGIGGETLGVAQSTFAALWFGVNRVDTNGNPVHSNPVVTSPDGERHQQTTQQEEYYYTRNDGKYLALAMGLNLSVGRLGSVVNDFLSPLIAFGDAKNGVVSAVYVGFTMCLLSLMAAIILVWIDLAYRHDFEKGKRMHSKSKGKGKEKDHNWIPLDNLAPDHPDMDTFVQAGGDVEIEDDVRVSSPATISKNGNNDDDDIKQTSSYWTTLSQLPQSYWITCILIILTYGTVVPFNTIHSMFLQTRFNMNIVLAAQIMAIPDSISMILTPFVGSFVDKFGYRAHTLMACGILLTMIHLSLGLATGASLLVPYVPLILLGICYAFLLMYWPILTLLVPKSILSTSYGIASCILNLSLTIFPMIVSTLIIWDISYYCVEMLFVGCAATSVVLSWWLIQLDHLYHNDILKKR